MGNSKPFYIKYLKSSLKPESGCYMYDTAKKEIFEADDDVQFSYALRGHLYINAFRVDLFICARDRNLLCPLYYDTVNKEFYTLDQIEKVYGVKQAMADQSIIPVLGYLSPLAGWVNQGDEFDYSEVEPNERWYDRGTISKWLKMNKVYLASVNQTPFAREGEGKSIRAISVKSPQSGAFS